MSSAMEKRLSPIANLLKRSWAEDLPLFAAVKCVWLPSLQSIIIHWQQWLKHFFCSLWDKRTQPYWYFVHSLKRCQGCSDCFYNLSLPLVGALWGSTAAWGKGKDMHRKRYSVMKYGRSYFYLKLYPSPQQYSEHLVSMVLPLKDNVLLCTQV